MWFVTCTNQEKKFINLPSKCNHGQRKCFILFIIVIGWPLSTDRSNLCIENSWQNELPFSALKRSNTFQQEKKNIFIKQNRQISLTMKVIGCHIHSSHRLPDAWDKSGGKRKEKSGVPPHVLSFRSPYCIVLTRSRGSLLHLSLCTKRSLLGFRLC